MSRAGLRLLHTLQINVKQFDSKNRKTVITAYRVHTVQIYDILL